MRSHRRILMVLMIALAGLFFSEFAFAQTTSTSGTSGSNVMTSVMTQFQTQIQAVQSKAISNGEELLILLVTIQLGLSSMMAVLGNGEIGELLKNTLVKNIMIMGFFFALIKGGSTYLNPIEGMFFQLGQSISGMSTSITPSGVIDQGIDTMNMMLTSFGTASQTAANTAVANASGVTGTISAAFSAMAGNFFASLEIICIAIIIFISFVGMALGLALTTVQFYLWTALTPFLLGFGGLNFTRDMAITALKGGISIGMKVLMTDILVSIASNLASAMGASLGSVTLGNLTPLWECAAASAFFLVMAWSIPKLASDLLNGTSSMSPGEAVGQAATVIAGALGAGAAGAAALGAAGKGGVNAAAGATGLARALSAGMNSGLDLGKSGTALAAHTMGEVGSHGLGLMKGAIGGAGSAFAQKVDSSAGGKIASSINATRGGSMSPIPVPPDANPGGGGSGGGSGGGDLGGGAPGGSGGGDSGGSGGGGSGVGGSGAGASPVDASNAGASPADSTSAGGGGGSGSGGIPVPTPQSDASSAAISGGSGSSNPVKPPKSSLTRAQEGLQSLASQMPQDGHTVGVNANINHSLGE